MGDGKTNKVKVNINTDTPYTLKHKARTAFDSSPYDEIFKDTPYWDTYQATLNQYAQGPEAQWLGFLGADAKNAYQHNQSRMNAINALLEQKRLDEYNDPASQAAREKQAGLNPDLTGLSDVGQSDSASTPNQSDMQYENPIPHMVSFLTMLGGAVNGIQSLKTNSILAEGAELENYAKAKDIVLGTLQNFNPKDLSYLAEDGSYLIPKMNNSGTSRRVARRLNKVYNQFWDSVEHDVAWRRANGNKAEQRQRLFDIISTPGYNDNDVTMRKTAKFIADQMLDIQKLQMEASKFGATGEKARQKLWSNALESERGFMKWLRERADKGDVVATRLLLSLIGSPNMQDNASVLGSLGKVAKFAITKRL